MREKKRKRTEFCEFSDVGGGGGGGVCGWGGGGKSGSYDDKYVKGGRLSASRREKQSLTAGHNVDHQSRKNSGENSGKGRCRSYQGRHSQNWYQGQALGGEKKKTKSKTEKKLSGKTAVVPQRTIVKGKEDKKKGYIQWY